MHAGSSLRIDARFRGPPQSGNGGYVSGLLAAQLGSTATVRLLSPPPLDLALHLGRNGNALELLHADTIVARAVPNTLELAVPAPPTLEQAREAAQRYAGFAQHPFPGCFVCGPERAPEDGLRIFPGVVAGRELVAAPWTPAANLAGADGRIRSEFVWSALDCTGFFAFGPLPDAAPALLGELTARIDAELRAGEPHIVSGWSIGADGRKRFAGSAIHAADGRLLAFARATWIVMTPVASAPA